MKNILTLIFCCFSCICFSQSENYSEFKEPKTKGFVFSPGIIIQKEIFTEFSIGYGDIYTDFKPKMVPNIGFKGFKLGMETNLKSKADFIIAPKIGYEISITYFSIRLSALNYFKNNQSEFRLLPEAGISLGGLVNLTYGYGIGFGNTIHEISNHRLTLSFNLNRKLFKAAKYKR